MSKSKNAELPDSWGIIGGTEAIDDYLERLRAGRLTETEKRVGVPQKAGPAGQEHARDTMSKDEFPDENVPND